jgi:glutamyl-tRNA(Gln) amidotransferase subunit D
LSASDLYSIVPELSEIARVDSEILFSLYSENITPKHWSDIARKIAQYLEKDITGIVVAHGTDTLGYTAAALSFALQNLPIPVVLVASQRSSDRPSSDAAINLIGTVRTATQAPFAEVVVAMHQTTSDKSIILHRGTKVRKCHTSRRDAFRSINTEPIARIENESLEMLIDGYTKRDSTRNLILKPNFDEKVALIKFHPGLNPEIIEWYIDRGYHGIILEGTGLGHVGHSCFSAIKRAVENNLVVAISSQCIWGRLGMNVYDTGRDLLALGVLPLEDILAETALVKLMWAFGQTQNIKEVKSLLQTNISHEFSPRSLHEVTEANPV